MRKKNQSTEFIKYCIVRAFMDLLYERDYDDINVSDICEKAGVGRTTYYRHFTNRKLDLIRYLGFIKWEEYKKSHEVTEKNETEQLFTHVFNNKKFFLRLKDQNIVEVIYMMLYDILGPSKEQSDLLMYGKAFFIGGYFGVIYQWIQGGCKETYPEVEQKFKDGIMFAIMEQKKKEDQQK